VKLLIESGADVNAADRVRNWPPLFHALGSNALRPDEEEVRYAVVKVLIDGGANLNVVDSGETALMKAVSIEDVRLVQLLISAGAKVNIQDRGDTAYSRAAVLGNQKLKEILLEAGADPTIGVAHYKKEWGEQAFFQAAADGRVDVVEVMLSNGTATVNMTNSYKATALMRAHDERMVDVLIRAGADVNLRNEIGFTALMWASAAGRASIVEKLIAAGADVNARANDGKAVIDLAANDEIEQLLKAAGAKRQKSPL
jgi:ankyrin repeat protein